MYRIYREAAEKFYDYMMEKFREFDENGIDIGKSYKEEARKTTKGKLKQSNWRMGSVVARLQVIRQKENEIKKGTIRYKKSKCHYYLYVYNI